MTAKTPPVPPANRGRQDPDPRQGVQDETAPKGPPDPDKQGQQGNIRQNTRHQGYQQDR